MQVELSSTLLEILRELARKQGRGVDALVQEAVEHYLVQQAKAAEFDEDVRRIMDEHHWLLDKLAE